MPQVILELADVGCQVVGFMSLARFAIFGPFAFVDISFLGLFQDAESVLLVVFELPSID
jgi:hypothetical protein